MWRLLGGTGILVAVYFMVPLKVDGNLAVRAVLTIVGIVAAAAILIGLMRRTVRGTTQHLYSLGLAIVAGVLVFALTDYLIATTQPGEFAELQTRLDALYFALTTLATVGYGDVHAQGQLARAIVSLQLVFNVVIIATAGSIILGKLRQRRSIPER